jgi:hypothetical protein
MESGRRQVITRSGSINGYLVAGNDILGKKKVVHHLTSETMDYHDSAHAESSPP